MKLKPLFFSLLTLFLTAFVANEASANSNFADIAKATCSGKLHGLNDIKEGAYQKKSTSAMLWLRWLYTNKKCSSTYIGHGAETKKLLLMAADAGDAGAALTVGRYMIRGTGGFDVNIKAGKDYLYKSANAGESDAGLELAEEFVSGERFKQDLELAQKLVEWVKRRDFSNNFRIKALEMKLIMKGIRPNNTKTKVAKAQPNKTQPTKTAKTRKANTKPANQTTTAGAKGELVYSGMPLQQECWRFVDRKTALTDSRIIVTRQNELRTAKRDSVRAGNDRLIVRNFYTFNIKMQGVRDRSVVENGVGVAEKLSYYSPNKPPECTVSTTSFATRNDMLASIKKHFGRIWPAKKLDWRLVSVPRETLGQLKQVGIVTR